VLSLSVGEGRKSLSAKKRRVISIISREGIKGRGKKKPIYRKYLSI